MPLKNMTSKRNRNTKLLLLLFCMEMELGLSHLWRNTD